MNVHRRVHIVAGALNGSAIAAAITDHPRTAAVILAASITLLIWSLERVRVLISPRQEPRR